MTVIAIDGPSGSGKSTIARLIAERLQLPYLDTGAMYRAVGMVALAKGVGFADSSGIEKIAAEVKLQMLDERRDGKLFPLVVVNGVDSTAEIRTPEVSQAASAVGVHPPVRERLVRRQRNWVLERKGGVVEGRDIGTVVFPDADLKVFLDASHDERVRRRAADEHAVGFDELSHGEVKRELAERDQRDSNRAASPLAVAEGALVIDTSDKDIEEVVMDIMVELRKRNGGELPMGAVR
jgi:CMP/dCMP kinase